MKQEWIGPVRCNDNTGDIEMENEDKASKCGMDKKNK